MATCTQYPVKLIADIYIRPLSAPGTPSGNGTFARLECEAHTTEVGREITTDRSKSRSCRDDLRGTFIRRGDMTVGFTFRDIAPVVLAGHLLGSAAAISRAGAAVVDEAVTFPAHGEWVKLAFDRIKTTGVSLTQGAGDPKVEGTDFELNRRLGMVRSLAGGSITTASACAIDYEFGTVTGTKIDAAQLEDYLCEVYVDAVNESDVGEFGGKDIVGHYHALHLAPDGEVDWLSDDPVTITLSGPAATPTGETAPGSLSVIAGVTYA